MPKLKLLYLIESSETGGAENIFLQLVEKTDRARFSVTVGLFYKGWLYEELVKRGFSPLLFVNKKGGYDIKLLWQLAEFIRRNRIDLVCSHLFSANLYAAVAAKISNVPVVAVFHGTMDVSPNDKKVKVKFLLLNCCVWKIVYVSEFLQKFFGLNFKANQKKSVVIHNGIESAGKQVVSQRDMMRNRLGVDTDDFLAIAIGDIRPAKDYPTLLKAIFIARKEIADLKLIIAGTRTDLIGELERLTEHLGLTDCVQFLGYREDVRAILPCCDTYVSSSMSEGFSLTVVEAMAAMVPVIATRSGGPDEIVEHGVTGILVRPGEPRLLANAIVGLQKDSSLRTTLAEGAVEVAVKKFSLKRMVSQYEKLFDEVCRG